MKSIYPGLILSLSIQIASAYMRGMAPYLPGASVAVPQDVFVRFVRAGHARCRLNLSLPMILISQTAYCNIALGIRA
jgi:hypothetical protein